MKKRFAVPTVGGKLCAHFGHCQEFIILDVDNQKITSKTAVAPPAHAPGVLPAWLHTEHSVDIIIASGMGNRARELFTQNNIEVCVGAPHEEPEKLVSDYLTGSLETGDNLCDH